MKVLNRGWGLAAGDLLIDARTVEDVKDLICLGSSFDSSCNSFPKYAWSIGLANEARMTDVASGHNKT
jgi:hypothetical protein